MPTSSSAPRQETRSFIVATAGHVDHGKTALVSHLTGVNTDTLAEEKARGLTINLGYAYHHFKSEYEDQAQSNTLGFVDVPGHIDFINNMLAGVSAVDAAMLVIAADDGIMPQTREHLDILSLLGISTGLIVVSKIDRVETERVNEVIQDIRNLIASTPLQDAPIFAVSNIDKTGIPELLEHLQQVAAQHSRNSAAHEHEYFRFLIDRSFSVKGIGTVVTGSTRAGQVDTGASVMHSATGNSGKIRGLRLDSTDLDSVAAGQRAAINLNLNHGDITRGDWLVDAALLSPCLRFDGTLDLLDTYKEADNKIRSNTQYHLFIGASHHIVTIRKLGTETDSLYQFKCDSPMLAHFADRFVIRDPASKHTIGGGSVLDIFVPRRKRNTEERIATLNAMNNEALAALIALLEISSGGIDLNQFTACRNINSAGMAGLLERLTQENSPFELISIDGKAQTTLLHQKFFAEHSARILEQLALYHEQHGSQAGISEPALSRSVNFENSHALFHGLIQSLLDRQAISRTGTLLHLPGHKSSMSEEEQDFLDKIRPILLKAGYIPPRTRELVELTGVGLKPLEQTLRLSAKAGSLIKVAENRYYLPETIMQLAELTETIAESTTESEGFSVIQFRDASGIGRNLCIEILEYFDHTGFTRREDNSRLVRTEKENIFGK